MFDWISEEYLAYPPYITMRREGDDVIVTIRTEPTITHDPETHTISITSGSVHSIRAPISALPA